MSSFNPKKYLFSLAVNPHQANLQPQLFLFNSLLCFNPTLLFLWLLSTEHFLFLHMYLCVRPNSSLVSRSYATSLLPRVASSRSPFFIKLFSGPFSLALHPDDFYFSTLLSSNAFNKQPVGQPPAFSRSTLSFFSSQRPPFFPYIYLYAFRSVIL